MAEQLFDYPPVRFQRLRITAKGSPQLGERLG